MPYIADIIRVELIASTILIVLLLILSFVKSDEIISDTGLARLKSHYSLFKIIFALAVLGVIFYLFILYTEMLAWHLQAPLGSVYPVWVDAAMTILSFIVLLVSLLNLYIVLRILGVD